MEAPLVCLDEEFEDLRPCRMEDHCDDRDSSYSSSSSSSSTGRGGGGREHVASPPLVPIAREDFSELENFSEMMSFKSMEDLVNEFDEKLNVCFHNYNTKTECLAPIRSQAHTLEDEERLQDEDVWDALTDNYISSWDNPTSETLNGNLSDQEIHEKEEEEMNEKNDNANCLNEEPLITADQVIEEIEIRQLSQASNNNCSYEGSALQELLKRVEAAILCYSEELVSQLARREELEFEKE
ncbi:hypothetical protein NHX12_010426, partial [Muraenolepis orangiensis]